LLIVPSSARRCDLAYLARKFARQTEAEADENTAKFRRSRCNEISHRNEVSLEYPATLSQHNEASIRQKRRESIRREARRNELSL